MVLKQEPNQVAKAKLIVVRELTNALSNLYNLKKKKSNSSERTVSQNVINWLNDIIYYHKN